MNIQYYVVVFFVLALTQRSLCAVSVKPDCKDDYGVEHPSGEMFFYNCHKCYCSEIYEDMHFAECRSATRPTVYHKDCRRVWDPVLCEYQLLLIEDDNQPCPYPAYGAVGK